MRRSGRSGFTLVELLVVIAIMGVLIGLLLPALLMVNSIMRRTHCLTNMRSIGEALHTHESLNNTFPPGLPSCTDAPKGAKEPVPWITGGVSQGAYCQGPAPLASLLAQLEETKMYEDLLYCLDAPKTIFGKTYKDGYNAFEDCYSALDYRDNTGSPQPLHFGAQTPKVYLCPSADRMTYAKRLALNETVYGLKGGMGKGNYVLNWGNNSYVSFALNPKTAGPFRIVDVRTYKQRDPHESKYYIPAQPDHPYMLGKWKLGLGKGTRSTDVRDGTSTTMMISEIVGWDSQTDARGVWTTTAMGGSIFTAKYPPNTRRIEEADVIPMCDEDGTADSDMPCKQNQKDGWVWASPRSRHTGGVNVVLVDGSGQFISDAIDLVTVWQPLSTIAGDETFEMPQ